MLKYQCGIASSTDLRKIDDPDSCRTETPTSLVASSVLPHLGPCPNRAFTRGTDLCRPIRTLVKSIPLLPYYSKRRYTIFGKNFTNSSITYFISFSVVYPFLISLIYTITSKIDRESKPNETQLISRRLNDFRLQDIGRGHFSSVLTRPYHSLYPRG